MHQLVGNFAANPEHRTNEGTLHWGYLRQASSRCNVVCIAAPPQEGDSAMFQISLTTTLEVLHASVCGEACRVPEVGSCRSNGTRSSQTPHLQGSTYTNPIKNTR